MRRTVITSQGAVQLGEEAQAAGYGPGAVVDVVRLSTGSLLVTLTDEPVIDLPPLKPLKPKGRQPALAAGRQR